MPVFGGRSSLNLSSPFMTVTGAGPRLLFAFLAALLIASIARAKLQSFSEIKKESRVEKGLIAGVPTLNSTDRSRSSYWSEHSYPQNLPRVYEGSWESKTSLTPFQNVGEKTSAKQALAFERMKGSLSLHAENYHREGLGTDLHYVIGELLIRDGTYHTVRDVLMKTIGVYDYKTGLLVLVGDFTYDEDPLPRLYRAVAAQKDNWGMNETEFISALEPVLEEQKIEQFVTRRGGKAAGNTVESICLFEAVLWISKGHLKDSVPQAEQSSNHDDSDNEFVSMLGSLSSPSCSTTMEIKLTTFDTEQLFVKAINYTLLVTFVAFTQVLVLIRQMEMTSTPSGANRVSLLSVGMQTVSDSYLCLAHLTMGMFAQRFSTLFNAFATAAFFKFIIFSIFEMRYMLMIWNSRRPSGFSGGWEAMRRELSILYSRFYGSLLLGIIILYKLQKFVRFFLFFLYSFWVPQIVLSVVEDHRRPLHPLYIVGMSVTLLAIPLYFLSCPHNFLNIQPHFMTGNLLIAWLALQATLLLLQHRFGARCFIPKRFLPEKYDYYRTIALVRAPSPADRIREMEVGNQNSADVSLTANDDSYRNHSVLVGHPGHRIYEVDCVICMQNVAVNGPNRMATPCEHVFHEDCLQQWMDVKMECPTCRRTLPPP